MNVKMRTFLELARVGVHHEIDDSLKNFYLTHLYCSLMTLKNLPFDRLSPTTRVVFFTGAGISAESGIATFRDPEGHWARYDPMKLASPAGFLEDPELVLNWYADRREGINGAEPNAAHLSITDFQKLFSDSVVITQNVDGLHDRAGNVRIIELHGNIHRQKCHRCGTPHIVKQRRLREIQKCECGGMIRPDVVWFGESLPMDSLNRAFDATEKCDLMFSIGTSAQIYPAAQLPYEAQNRGAFVIEINPEPTPFSTQADLCFHEEAGSVLPKIYEEIHAQLI